MYIKRWRNFYQTAGNYIKELNGTTRDILIADFNDIADVSWELLPKSIHLMLKKIPGGSKKGFCLRDGFLY